jgi:UDP-2,3-diacylglucosamine pyrophosphatase LpxH
MRTIITSDIHLGSRQSRAADFLAFLDALPAGDRLVLNGDVITHFAREGSLPAAHAAVLDKLRAMSREREVIWLRGNNDRHFELRDPAGIVFARDYVVDGRLYVAHGDRFDHLMPLLRGVLIPLRVVYEFCTRVVGKTTHVASFAKRFPFVYNVLNGHVARNAMAYARVQGLQAVTCGHTHHPEEREAGAVRYFNTGCWTEESARVLIVDGGSIYLQSASS